ncbi:hypothetical protein C5S30_05040 [ANME-1 cluster archaeon GoMg4]|nr:hypothetical protein [ANME-1 cluster archaeon GoMg4]
MREKDGYKPKAPLLEDLRKTWHDKSDEGIIAEMRINGYEPFHIPFGPNYRKIAFRRIRVQ